MVVGKVVALGAGEQLAVALDSLRSESYSAPVDNGGPWMPDTIPSISRMQ